MWQELISAPPQGNTWEAPGSAPGAPLALQPFRAPRFPSGPLPEDPGSSQHVVHESEALVTPTKSPSVLTASQGLRLSFTLKPPR